MRLKTAINKKHDALIKINDICSKLIIFKNTSKAAYDEYYKFRADNLAKAPKYIKSYLDGFFDAKIQTIRNDLIEFCYIIDGRIVSCRRGSKRHYSNFEYTAHDLIDKPNGLYWIDSNKPYFVD